MPWNLNAEWTLLVVRELLCCPCCFVEDCFRISESLIIPWNQNGATWLLFLHVLGSLILSLPVTSLHLSLNPKEEIFREQELLRPVRFYIQILIFDLFVWLRHSRENFWTGICWSLITETLHIIPRIMPTFLQWLIKFYKRLPLPFTLNESPMAVSMVSTHQPQ